MYLKSLEVQGFKSFPDRTLLKFNDGITAIVGPNGSGKSNISDAIRWVMGEQSTKSLRGFKMEDVVFDGTQERKSLGFAEVSLTLDNTDGALSIEYNEVTVTRRYYRSGESEYMINRTPVRLKDINELFMDTGLGRDGYSLIGQGRISEILSVKNDERRQIFEEAAGISKYRYRKSESERKLTATDENIIRIKDILTDLEERVEPLREQSEKAKKYLDLRDEKKKLEINVWLDTIDKIMGGKKKFEEDCQNARAQLEGVEKAVLDLESSVDETYSKIQEKSVLLEKTREDIRSLEEQAVAKEADATLINNDIAHNNENILRIENEMSEEMSKVSDFDNQIAEFNEKIALMEEELSHLEKELSDISGQTNIVSEQVADTYGKMDGIKNEAVSKSNEITDLRIKEGSISAALESNKISLEKIISDTNEREDEFKKALERQNEIKKGVLDREEKLQSNKNILDGYEIKIKTAQEKVQKLASDKNILSNTLDNRLMRINTLKDMESHFEGFAHSVKAVMQNASRGVLKGIHGPLSSIIKVEDKYSVAVETALGGAIANIITDTEEDAKKAIYHLKSSNEGRATFLPLTSVKGEKISDNGLKSHRGYLGLASELVKYDGKYTGIINFVLGRTIAVESLDDAIALAKKTNYRNRIVTLDGQLINAGGSLTGGSTGKNSGILTRANEIEKLENEAKELKEKLSNAESILKEHEAKLAKDTAYLDGVTAEYRTLEEELIRERANAEHVDILVTGLKNALSDLATEKDNLIKAQETLTVDRTSALQKIEELDNKVKELDSEYNALSDGHGDLSAQIEKLTNEYTDKKMVIMAKQKDISAAQESKESIIKYKDERESRKGEKEKEIALLKEKNISLEELIVLAKNKAQEFLQKAALLQTEIQKIQAEREGFEKETIEVRQSIKDKQGDRDKLIREVERLESKRENIDAEYDALIARLWDEYELTYSEAEEFRFEIPSITKAQSRINEIKGSIKRLGDVNVGAIEEYKQVKEKYDFLSAQTADLLKAKADLEKIISDLTEQMKVIFSERFKVINTTFGVTFKELFGGGEAELILTEPSDVLSSGIEIKVTPPGKIIKNLTALSGGEQAFVAIALYFAILKVRPTSFCVLDEIETALDDINVSRFAEYMRKLTKRTQFIVVTHRRGTMEEADILYGVTMQEKGVSKLLTINVKDVFEHLNLTE